MQDKLTLAGHKVVNQGYPSRDFEIETLALKAITPALKECQNEKQISFVTHSLGGILVRQYLSIHPIKNLKSVVMLGPPNGGSEAVDKLKFVPGFGFINGKAGLQLGTNPSSIPMSLGKAEFNLGIIAGSLSINWILSSLIPGSDDGKVSTDRAKLEGMNDFIELTVSHPFMMKNDTVISQVIHFLDYSHFDHDASDDDLSKRDENKGQARD